MPEVLEVYITNDRGCLNRSLNFIYGCRLRFPGIAPGNLSLFRVQAHDRSREPSFIGIGTSLNVVFGSFR